MSDLERVDGVHVVRIADAGLASMAEIATRLGRTREGVRLLISGARGPGGFPPPVTDPRGRYRLWRWSDVAQWFTEHMGEEVTLPLDDVAAAVNAALELRYRRCRLVPSDRVNLHELVGTLHSPVPTDRESVSGMHAGK